MRARFLGLGLCSFMSLNCGGGNQPPPPPSNCVTTSPTDAPELTAPFTDQNCDAIDGDSSMAIFVDDTTGNDSNAGDMAHPMKKISAAILKAKASGKSSIYISQGAYVETVALMDGISLYGAYSAANQWKRDESYKVVIQNAPVAGQSSTALEASNIVSPTIISQLTFHALSPASSESTYAARFINCPKLVVDHTSLIAEDGGNGSPGLAVATPSPASAGHAGSPRYSCDSIGGAGGAGSGNGSHIGGAGGHGGGASSVNGQDGGSVPGLGTSGAGGAGGTGGSSGTAGSPGSTPFQLCLPVSGMGGAGGTITAQNEWVSNPGIAGTPGAAGLSGSGGGGSGAVVVTITIPPSTFTSTLGGNGGGGGGSGGLGGLGGLPGAGGGASIAALVINTSGLTIQDSMLKSGNGGTGGTGGVAGTGGAGGPGGPGGTVVCGSIMPGGNGGEGRTGCSGGFGGGGAGGPSYALYRHQSTVNLNASTVMASGIGGAGGAGSPGAPVSTHGAAGASGLVF